MPDRPLGKSSEPPAVLLSNEQHTRTGSLRLASSAQPDRSINHGCISAAPGIIQVAAPHRCQVLITPRQATTRPSQRVKPFFPRPLLPNSFD